MRIARIEGNTVILDQPLRVRTRPQFETGFEAIGVIITESGVEDLTVELTSAPNLPDAHSHNVRHNAIYMTKTVNCWVRNVDIVNAQNGLMTRATKHVELRDIRILGEVRLHHAFSIVRGHDNLITDFVIEPRVSHGISVEDLASGNVFRRGQMGFGTDSGGGSFDSHRYMSFDLLRTDIYVLNTIGRPGGNNNTGPLVGRRVVHWNIQGNTGDNNGEWVNHPDAHSLGALVGVQGPRFDGPAWAMVPGDKGNIIADEGIVPVYPDLYDKQMQWRQATEAWAELTHPHLDLIPPGLITLAAEINPGQAVLQSVTFLVNDQPLHTVTEAPFTAPWETSGGVYDVRVIAQTSAGVVTSPRRQIIVGQREIVEDTDSRLVYTGPKTVSDDGNSSGGTHTDFRAQNNAYVTFDFRGTRFMIYIRSVQRDQQRMEIFINDLENPVALISPPRLTEYRMLAFDSGPLPDGDHTVRIRPPDNRVTLDYILIDNTGEHGGGGGSPDPIPVTGVDLHPESLSLYAGATEALTAAIAPANASNPNVNWSSSNPSVATVNSSGLVAGVGQGSTTITVTTVDGGFTASTSVTVIDLAIGAGIIMDSEDSSGILITGSWNTSTFFTGFLGFNYLHDSNNGKGSKSVQFTPVIGQAGIYEVAVLYTSDSNRANNVPVEIMHDGEISQVIVNQRTGGGHWYVLGNYSFTAGTGNSVTISNASTNGFVIVDAVRFVLFEPDVTEPPVLFADWIAQFDDVTPSDRGKLATPARDGIANLLKYAFGAGPLDDAVARLPVYWTESGENGHHVYMRYNRLVGGTETGNHRYAVNDLVYRVGVSHDLVNWTFPDAGEPSLIEPVGLPVADPDDPRLEQVVFRLHTPLHPAAQPRAFLRLLVDTSSE